MYVCVDPIPFWLSLTIVKPYQTTLGNLYFLLFGTRDCIYPGLVG